MYFCESLYCNEQNIAITLYNSPVDTQILCNDRSLADLKSIMIKTYPYLPWTPFTNIDIL